MSGATFSRGTVTAMYVQPKRMIISALNERIWTIYSLLFKSILRNNSLSLLSFVAVFRVVGVLAFLTEEKKNILVYIFVIRDSFYALEFRGVLVYIRNSIWKRAETSRNRYNNRCSAPSSVGLHEQC